MSDQSDDLKAEDLSAAERPLSIPPELPVLPLRDAVLFPNSCRPLAVARESSVRLIDDAIANGKLIAVFTQRDAAVEEPLQADLYGVGTATHIHKMFKLPDGSLRLIVQGLSRLTLDEVVETHPYVRARIHAANKDSDEADRLEVADPLLVRGEDGVGGHGGLLEVRRTRARGRRGRPARCGGGGRRRET